MKAITVKPMTPGSAQLDDISEPEMSDGTVLVEAIAVGVCGTDVEIVEGKYGWAPPGKENLVPNANLRRHQSYRSVRGGLKQRLMTARSLFS